MGPSGPTAQKRTSLAILGSICRIFLIHHSWRLLTCHIYLHNLSRIGWVSSPTHFWRLGFASNNSDKFILLVGRSLRLLIWIRRVCAIAAGTIRTNELDALQRNLLSYRAVSCNVRTLSLLLFLLNFEHLSQIWGSITRVAMSSEELLDLKK